MAPVFAQKSITDSLAVLLAREKTDSNRVTLLWNMANACNIYNPDSALLLSQQSITLAKKIHFNKGESRALGSMANAFVKIGNYPRALDVYLQKLKIDETKNDPRNLASVNMNIGIVYTLQEEYRKALSYYIKADSLIVAHKIENLKYYSALSIGDVYNRLDINDSAFLFFNRSLTIAKKLNDGDLIGTSMVGLGHSYVKLGSDSFALQNYKGALPYLFAANDEEIICEAAIGLAKWYDKYNEADSAEHYGRLALTLAKKDGFQSWYLEAASFLTGHYKKNNHADSALAYLELAQALKDSINSKDRIRESQVLSSNEQLRQAEMIANREKAKEERAKQLQYLFIGIFIPGIFLLTLFLSHRKVNVKLIRVLGILSLLILFEYIILLLHPYVLELTHHKPVFEIMVFVGIAAILIPSHHRLEHWLIERLTHKRNSYTEGRLTLKTNKIKKKKPSDE